MVHYHPILLAKRGELSALGSLSAAVWADIKPVLQVPPREWDFDAEAYKKSLEEHLKELPRKFATATRGHSAFIDVSLIHNAAPVFGGHHPLAWLVDEAVKHGLELIPFIEPESPPATIAAAADIHARLGHGIGVRLRSNDWVSIAPHVLPKLLSACGLGASDTDIFIDTARNFSTIFRRALLTELSMQDARFAFRSRSVGGAAFPDTAGLPKGVSEFAREDWSVFRDTYRARVADGHDGPGFFDNAVQNPEVEVGTVNPRFLMISALFRYTADEEWLVAKGNLFKGPPGKSFGSSAMIAPLALMKAHPKYVVPIRAEADDWIDEVVAGTKNPGNPETWRRWATQRHLTVVAHQLASPI